MPAESSVEVTGAPVDGQEDILTEEALDFVAALQRQFGARRDELLAARKTRRDGVARTGKLDFLPDTEQVRRGDWTVAAAPPDLLDRRVEITGPPEPKMAINALNSAGVLSRDKVLTGSSMASPSMRPEGSSMFSRAIAARTSSGERL